MYKQLNHSNQEAAYLLGSILLFSFQGCKEKPVTSLNLSSTPNVIYVFPDQMRNHAMGFWREAGFREAVNFEGDPVHTPNLDRFAKESVVLTSAMSNCPLSSPHRGILLTGMYPEHSGVPLNCNANRPISSLREDATCISDVFSQAGYNCAYIGKLHVDCPTPNDRNVPENMWKTVFRLGMPTLRQNAGTVSTIGIRTGPMTCTSIRTIGIPKASNTR